MFYGGETWSLTLREEFIMRVLENRELRRPALAQKYYGLLCLLETTQDCSPKSLTVLTDRQRLS